MGEAGKDTGPRRGRPEYLILVSGRGTWAGAGVAGRPSILFVDWTLMWETIWIHSPMRKAGRGWGHLPGRARWPALAEVAAGAFPVPQASLQLGAIPSGPTPWARSSRASANLSEEQFSNNC